MPTMRDQLALAVVGPHGQTDEDFETLVWRVGQMRRDAEAAHAWLDLQGAPRREGEHALTLRGRMDALENRVVPRA